MKAYGKLAKLRRICTRELASGAYRSGADAVQPYLVKPKATLKFPAAGAMVSAGGTEGRSASGM